MNQLRNINNQKSIALLLLITISAIFLLPIQIHLHHDHNAHENDSHVIDYHLQLGVSDVEHIEYGDAHVIDTSNEFIAKQSSDNIAKQSSDNLFKTVTVIVLFLMMPMHLLSYNQRCYPPTRLNYQKCYCLSPPLRAPPL